MNVELTGRPVVVAEPDSEVFRGLYVLYLVRPGEPDVCHSALMAADVKNGALQWYLHYYYYAKFGRSSDNEPRTIKLPDGPKTKRVELELGYMVVLGCYEIRKIPNESHSGLLAKCEGVTSQPPVNDVPSDFQIGWVAARDDYSKSERSRHTTTAQLQAQDVEHAMLFRSQEDSRRASQNCDDWVSNVLRKYLLDADVISIGMYIGSKSFSLAQVLFKTIVATPDDKQFDWKQYKPYNEAIMT